MTRTDEDPTDGVSDPGTATPRPAWIRAAALLALLGLLLVLVVGSLV